jgi:hypothetical protein
MWIYYHDNAKGYEVIRKLARSGKELHPNWKKKL